MGLLDRLKSMVADMNEDEKKEFFEEFEKQKTESEPPEDPPEQLPDEIECTIEQTENILKLREAIISAKLALGKLLVDIEEMKSQGISNLKKNEDSLLESIQKIKADLIPDPSLLESYMIELPSESSEVAKLVKQ